jgi:hypothetical protein
LNKQSQPENHPHEPYVIEYTFSTGEIWRSCRAPGCRYNTGEGKHPASICNTHTKSDVLPQLTDDIVAPQIDDDFEEHPEPQVAELSAEGWSASGEAAIQPEAFEPNEGDEYEDEKQDEGDAGNEEVEGDDER